MKGKLIVLKEDGSITSTDLDAPPTLGALQAAVVGYLEVVPYFDTFEGQPCAAFCNEEGKLNGFALNGWATTAWHAAWDKRGLEGTPDDVLVGPVAIITGDAELLAKL